jgi:hypothetical protein
VSLKINGESNWEENTKIGNPGKGSALIFLKDAKKIAGTVTF